MITSNLTNLLLANKQYNKALYWTNKGIDLCIENNNSFFLPVLYHSKYKALIKMGNISEAKKIAIYVYTLFKVNGQTNLVERLDM